MAENWQLIGQMVPNYEWQIFSTPIAGSECFRIDQSFNNPPVGWALIGQFHKFPNILYGVRRIYPQREGYILELPIPALMKTRKLTTRHIGIKLAQSTLTWENDWLLYLLRLL